MLTNLSVKKNRKTKPTLTHTVRVRKKNAITVSILSGKLYGNKLTYDE